MALLSTSESGLPTVSPGPALVLGKGSDGGRSRPWRQFGWAVCGALRAQRAAPAVAAWGLAALVGDSKGICRRNRALLAQALAALATDRIPGSWNRVRGGKWWCHLASGGRARETWFYIRIPILSPSQETWVKASAAPLYFLCKLLEKNWGKQ